MNACCVSQSVFHQVLLAVGDEVSKKMFNGDIIFHLKRIMKRLFYYKLKTL